MIQYIAIASGLVSTVFGFGEHRCGNPGHAIACVDGIPTASGVLLSSKIAQAAVPMPKNTRTVPKWTFLKIAGGPCVPVRIVDKKHWRYIRKGGFDLNRKSVELLTGKVAIKSWSGRVFVCKPTKILNKASGQKKEA